MPLWGVSGGRPLFDVLAEPEPGSAAGDVDDRSWHVGVAAQVGGDRVVVGEAEDSGHLSGIDQVIGVDKPAHGGVSLWKLTATSTHLDYISRQADAVPAVQQHPGTRPDT